MYIKKKNCHRFEANTSANKQERFFFKDFVFNEYKTTNLCVTFFNKKLNLQWNKKLVFCRMAISDFLRVFLAGFTFI